MKQAIIRSSMGKYKVATELDIHKKTIEQILDHNVIPSEFIFPQSSITSIFRSRNKKDLRSANKKDPRSANKKDLRSANKKGFKSVCL